LVGFRRIVSVVMKGIGKMKSTGYLFGWVTIAAFLACGCFRPDIRTLLVNVPQMKSSDCSKIIQGSLSRIDGIVSTEPNIENHSILITYNSTKLGIKNIEALIAGIGFDANEEQGKPEAKAALPPECRPSS
jgi:copper chaperone CopZ